MAPCADRRPARAPWLLLAAFLATLVLAPAAPASAKPTLAIPTLGERPTGGPVVDGITRVREPAARAAATKASASRASASAADTRTIFTTPDGYSVTVTVSGAYVFDRVAARAYVDFLDGLLHDSELDRISVYIATPDSITGICGVAGALACYDPWAETMYIPGSEAAPGEPSQGLVIAHEYGHHIARNRRNDPWAGLAWGTKRWNTYEGVCSGVSEHRFFPGSLERYWENPGEAFAQAYAYSQYPDNRGPWAWTPELEPDEGAYAAIRQDVIHPWQGSQVRRLSRQLFPGSSRAKGKRFATPLDGRIEARLTGPRGTNFDLALLDAATGRVLARSGGPGSAESLSYVGCGRRAMRVRVFRRSPGGGRFHLIFFRP